jgi:hypothetical protein
MGMRFRTRWGVPTWRMKRQTRRLWRWRQESICKSHGACRKGKWTTDILTGRPSRLPRSGNPTGHATTSTATNSKLLQYIQEVQQLERMLLMRV